MALSSRHNLILIYCVKEYVKISNLLLSIENSTYEGANRISLLYKMSHGHFNV